MSRKALGKGLKEIDATQLPGVAKILKAIDKRMVEEEKTIAKIQEIRSKNNVAWMNILRIAVAMAPAETKKLLREITANDREVSKLTARLAAGGRRK